MARKTISEKETDGRDILIISLGKQPKFKCRQKQPLSLDQRCCFKETVWNCAYNRCVTLLNNAASSFSWCYHLPHIHIMVRYEHYQHKHDMQTSWMLILSHSREACCKINQMFTDLHVIRYLCLYCSLTTAHSLCFTTYYSEACL